MTTRNKTLTVAAAVIAVLALQAYAFVSSRNAAEERMGNLENELQAVRAASTAKASEMASDLNLITDKLGVTGQELARARDQLKQEQTKSASRLHNEIQEHSKAVD